jgi:hemolysin activation/secretion protein
MLKRLIVSAAALALAPLAAHAQDYQRVAPPAPPPKPAPALPTPPAATPPVDPNRLIMPALNGIRLIGSLKALDAAGAAPGVRSDVAFAAPVTASLQPFIGKPLTLRALAQIEGLVTLYYRSHHHPFVAVAVPRQDVSGGVIQIVITEYRAGKIRVLDNHWFSTRQIRGDIRLQSGETIDAARLEADLSWLNENPFRTVDLVVTPGAQVATTDLDFVVHDHLPLSVYAGYANDGSPATGVDRWKFGALWGDVLGSGQQLGYQFTASDDVFSNSSGRGGPSFMAQALTATIQLPWRDRLQIFGDYEQDRPNVGPDFASTGHSAQVSLRYIVPLTPVAHLAQQLSAGYDFKTTNNNLDFGGVAVSGQSSEIDQFPLAYQGTLKDPGGQTTVTDTLVLSPGGLTGRNTDAAFQPGVNQAGVAGASARYAYDRLDIERDTNLPRRFLWVVRLTDQFASGNLLPSEQLNIGGMDTVRGYNEQIVGGADGVVASTEVRTPTVAALFHGQRGWQDALQGDAFIDYGRVFNVRAIPGAPAAVTLASAGLGVRYAIGNHLNLRAEAGFPFDRLPGQRGTNAFANVAVTFTP